MKKIVVFLVFFSICSNVAQEYMKPILAEVSCGQCQFGMKEKRGCDLAIKIDNKTFFVDGTKIDDHGDAHATDGFCSKIRKAKVVGKVIDNRFVASEFVLLPETNLKKKKRRT